MDNVHYVVQEIIDPPPPPTEGTFALDPSTPWNLPSRGFFSERHTPRHFRSFPSWLGTPWK